MSQNCPVFFKCLLYTLLFSTCAQFFIYDKNKNMYDLNSRWNQFVLMVTCQIFWYCIQNRQFLPHQKYRYYYSIAIRRLLKRNYVLKFFILIVALTLAFSLWIFNNWNRCNNCEDQIRPAFILNLTKLLPIS